MWGLAKLKRLRRLKQDDSGVAAVEFAMVAPVFFFVFGCIIETGLMLFTEYVLQSSVQDAARQVRTGQAQAAAMGSSAFKDIICNTANAVMDCDGGVTVYVRSDTTFATLQANVPDVLTIGASSGGAAAAAASYDCGNPNEAMAVIATYDWQFVLPFMEIYGNVDGNQKRRLSGIAMFKNEPYPAGSACGA